MPIALCDTTIPDDQQFTCISENCLAENLQLVESHTLGCDCKGNCATKKSCRYWRKTVEKMLGKKPTDAELQQNSNACGEHCKCRADSCCNRVVQRGLQLKLQLFQTEDRGIGVRTMTDIPASTFVAAYNGQIIDENRAENRKNRYFFHLPVHSSDQAEASPPSPKKARKKRVPIQSRQNS